jgi:hypothetical protein
MATKKGLLLQRIANKSPRSCVIPTAMITTDSDGYTTLTTTTVPFVNITATGNTILGNLASADTVVVNAVTTMNGNLDVVGSDTSLDGLLEVTSDLTVTNGDIIVTANAKTLSFTGTGTDGGTLKNLKNLAATVLSGTKKLIQIDIAGVPYYFEVYPTKA